MNHDRRQVRSRAGRRHARTAAPPAAAATVSPPQAKVVPQAALPARAEPVARRPLEGAAPGHGDPEALQLMLPGAHPWVGTAAARIELPPATRLVGVLRAGQLHLSTGADMLHAGDGLLFVAPESELDRLNELLTPAPRVAVEAAQRPALRFVLAGDAALSEVLALYAPAQVAAVPAGLTLEAAIRAARPEPVEGDEVEAFGVRLAVNAMNGRRIAKVALPDERRAACGATNSGARRRDTHLPALNAGIIDRI